MSVCQLLNAHMTSVRNKTKVRNTIPKLSLGLCLLLMPPKKPLSLGRVTAAARKVKLARAKAREEAGRKPQEDGDDDTVDVGSSSRTHDCPHCPYSTPHRTLLTRHVRAIHDQIKDFACEECDYRASYRSSLEKHVLRRHGDPADKKRLLVVDRKSPLVVHVCPSCAYSTPHRRILARHVKAIHDRIKDNVCQYCGFASSEKASLEKHIRRKHEAVKDEEDVRQPKKKKRVEEEIPPRQKKTHQCPHCEFLNTDWTVMFKHVKSVHKIKEFVCHLCGYGTPYRCNLHKHLIGRHKEEAGEFPLTSAGVRGPTRKDYSCARCDFAETSKARMRKHEKEVHGKGEKKEECKLEVGGGEGGEDVVVKHELESDVEEDRGDRDEDDEGNEEENGEWQEVDEEREEVKQEEGLNEEHIKEEVMEDEEKEQEENHLLDVDTKEEGVADEPREEEEEEEDMEPAEEALLDSKIETPPVNLSCLKCEFQAADVRSLNRHDRTAHKELVCETCGFATSFRRSLTNHIKAIHQKIRDFVCPDCDFRSSRKDHLRIHVLETHEGTKEFRCQESGCRGFATSQRNQLLKHVREVHLRVRDHPCPHCPYSAARSNILRTHVKQVHDRIKDHRCPHCDFAASVRGHLLRHVRHVHDKVRNFQCAKCGFLTTRNSELQLHVKNRHGGEKDHKCLQCPYATCYRTNLLKHVRKTHGEMLLSSSSSSRPKIGVNEQGDEVKEEEETERSRAPDPSARPTTSSPLSFVPKIEMTA